MCDSGIKKPLLLYSGWVLFVAFLSLAQFRIFLLVFDSRLEAIIRAGYGVVEGTPHWRIFQSRVLGPYTAELISSVFNIGYQFGFLIAVFLFILVFYITFVVLCKQLFVTNHKIIVACLIAFVLNTILMQGYWVYLWDFIDLVVFSFIVWAILKDRSVWVFALIILLELFNREVALFFAGWMLLDALVRIQNRAEKSPTLEFLLDRKRAVVALILLVAGYVVIELLRSKLLVRELGPEIFTDVKESARFVNFQLVKNMESIARSISNPLHNYNIVFNFIIIFIPIVTMFLIRWGDDQEKRLSILFLILWVLTICFGLVYETRVWLSFVPYLAIVITNALFAREGYKSVPVH